MSSFGRVHIEVLVLLVLFGLLAIAFISYFSVAMHRGLDTQATSSAATAIQSAASATNTVMLKGQTLKVTIVSTPADQARGLGGRSGLAADEGMLFIFPQDGKYAFWMRDMRFSIDMVWFSSDRRVIYIAKDVAPDTYPQAFGPDAPSRYVLELPAGWAAAHGLTEGDTATF